MFQLMSKDLSEGSVRQLEQAKLAHSRELPLHRLCAPILFMTSSLVEAFRGGMGCEVSSSLMPGRLRG